MASPVFADTLECYQCRQMYPTGYMTMFQLATAASVYHVSMCMWCGANFTSGQTTVQIVERPEKSLAWNIKRKPKADG